MKFKFIFTLIIITFTVKLFAQQPLYVNYKMTGYKDSYPHFFYSDKMIRTFVEYKDFNEIFLKNGIRVEEDGVTVYTKDTIKYASLFKQYRMAYEEMIKREQETQTVYTRYYTNNETQFSAFDNEKKEWVIVTDTLKDIGNWKILDDDTITILGYKTILG